MGLDASEESTRIENKAKLEALAAASTYRLLEHSTRFQKATLTFDNIPPDVRAEKDKVIRQEEEQMADLTRQHSLVIGGANGERAGSVVAYHPEQHELFNPHLEIPLIIGQEVDVVESAIAWKDMATGEVRQMFPAKVHPIY